MSKYRRFLLCLAILGIALAGLLTAAPALAKTSFISTLLGSVKGDAATTVFANSSGESAGELVTTVTPTPLPSPPPSSTAPTTTWRVTPQLLEYPADKPTSCPTGTTLVTDLFNGGPGTETFTANGQTVTMTVTLEPTSNPDIGPTYSFTITGGSISELYFKSSNYKVYQYDPPYTPPGGPAPLNTGPVMGDTGVHDGLSEAGRYQALSHLDLCVGPPIEEEPPDVEILKVADADPINAGETAGFTITATNVAPADTGLTAENVTITDQLPAGIAWEIDPASDPLDFCDIVNNVLTCSGFDLLAGDSFSVHITGLTDAADCGTLTNTATVSAETEPAENVDENNTSTDTIVVNCPDVRVTKTGNADPINAGETATFTILVESLGPGTAMDVTLSDTLPTGVVWTIFSQPAGDPCSITAGVLNCDFGDLASGASRTVVIQGTTDAGECPDIDNTATVSASNEPSDKLENNTSTDTIVVNCPDIRIDKTGNGPISAGDEASFTITVSNLGPGVATNVSLNDPLPDGVVWSITGGSGAGLCSIDATTNTLSCDFNDMAASGPTSSYTVIISGDTDTEDCPSIVNVLATADADNDDPVTDTATIVVNCPDLRIEKSGNGPINAGDVASFTITVTNNGPGLADNVTIDDDLPSGVVWSESPDKTECAIVGGHLHCDVGDLAAGATFSVTVSGTTDAADCAGLNNTAFADAENDGQVSDTASITVLCSVIIIDKVTVPAGDPQEFSFSGAFGPELTDDDTPFNSGAIAPGQYTVSEDGETGWDLTNLVCDDANSVENIGNRTATINVEGGETVTCVFTNTKRGTVSINKTFQGGAIPEGESFLFQLRQGASTTSNGQILVDNVIVNSTTQFPLQLNGLLIPGDYQVCEYIEAGWDSSIRTMLGAFVPNSMTDPSETDNSFVCVSVTIDPGENEVVNIDNTPPPGGMAKTIGYWKNHASCKQSNGKQDPVLDQVLATFENGVVFLGNYPVNTCEKAVAILDKRTTTTGKNNKGTKAASDPAYNMAAQLLAAKLNLQAGANEPFCIDEIIAEADELLAYVGFNGSSIPSYNVQFAAEVKARMNYLAGLLDAYNNNELNCGNYDNDPLDLP